MATLEQLVPDPPLFPAALGTFGGAAPTAADLQIGCTLRVLLTIGDLRPLIGRPGEQVARRWFPNYLGDVPAGAFPAGWVPSIQP